MAFRAHTCSKPAFKEWKWENKMTFVCYCHGTRPECKNVHRWSNLLLVKTVLLLQSGQTLFPAYNIFHTRHTTHWLTNSPPISAMWNGSESRSGAREELEWNFEQRAPPSPLLNHCGPAGRPAAVSWKFAVSFWVRFRFSALAPWSRGKRGEIRCLWLVPKEDNRAAVRNYVVGIIMFV